MRDLGFCFSKNAIQVVASSTSSSSAHPTQTSVTCIYKTTLSTQRHLLTTVTWSKTTTTLTLTITFPDSNPSTSFKLTTTNNSHLFKKNKGTKSFKFNNTKLQLFWDLSTAHYTATGPEPIHGYSILLLVDSQLGLILGDTASKEAAMKKVKTTSTTPAAGFSLISRREWFAGDTLYSTKARLCENGVEHEILISCGGENGGGKDSVLSVRVDGKVVVRVKRVQWNFRGNQTFFVDGLLVDLMWDVHDWVFNPGKEASSGVFMFMRRSGEEDKIDDFSFLIHACKNP